MWIMYALLASALWGLNYALCETILENCSVITMLAISMLFGAIFFFIVAYFHSLKTDLLQIYINKKIFHLMLMQIVTFTAANMIICFAIKDNQNAPLSALVESIYPFFALIFVYLLFGKSHFNWQILVGGCLIFSGLGVVYFS